jgi:hypothetical protein
VSKQRANARSGRHEAAYAEKSSLAERKPPVVSKTAIFLCCD